MRRASKWHDEQTESDKAVYSEIQSLSIVAWATAMYCTVLFDRHQHILFMFLILQSYHSETLLQKRMSTNYPTKRFGAELLGHHWAFAQCSGQGHKNRIVCTTTKTWHPILTAVFSAENSIFATRVCLLKLSSEKDLPHQQKAIWHEVVLLNETWIDTFNVGVKTSVCVCVCMHIT